MKKLLIFTIILCLVPFAVLAEEPAVPILLYHNVTTAYNYADAQLNVTPERFEKQLTALKNGGYNIISFREYINYVNGQGVLPPNSVIITFDDGYSGVYNHAYPILMRQKVHATIFVISGLIGFNDTVYPHFTWEQAIEMDRSGYVDIQSHTNFHYNAREIPLPRLILELRKSKFDIETRLNKTCDILAFPYGEYGETELEAAKNAGYICVSRANDRGTNRKSGGLFHLNRIFVRGTWTGEDLLKIIAENNKQ